MLVFSRSVCSFFFETSSIPRQSDEEASIKEELGAAVAEPVSVCTALRGASLLPLVFIVLRV